MFIMTKIIETRHSRSGVKWYRVLEFQCKKKS